MAPTLRQTIVGAVFSLIFSPLCFAQSLRDAVDMAIHSNPEILATVDRRLAAGERLKQARSGYFPRVDLNAGVGAEQLDASDRRLFHKAETAYHPRDASLTLSQMLFDGFGTRNDIRRQNSLI